ncbi:hypothetical protein ABH926_007573 [Catenulispora sp. GP43]|uniref:hypothetical protein n=1 Tax=Catenulispora sp. GP43 TaxID=3156263 RepID=UPI0035133C29
MRDDLPHAMRETARKLEPDVGRLAAGGVSRGTRMRRVERAVQVMGSVLAVAVVFAGVALFENRNRSGTASPATSNTPGNGFATATATAPSATAPTTNTPSTTAPDATTSSSAGPPQISAEELDSTLKSCLSGTGVTGRDYAAASTGITVSAQLTDGPNVGFIAIDIAGPEAALPGRGTPQILTDQSVVYISTGPGTSDGRHVDKTELTVTLVRPDGTSLVALETNSPSEKNAAAPGTPLLLAAKQVIAMLDSPAWDSAAAAASAASAASAQGNGSWSSGRPSSTISPQDLLTTASPPAPPSSPPPPFWPNRR